MSSDLNTVNIIGRLTGEPKLFVDTTEMKIIGFSIANNRVVKKDKPAIVSFINCKAFGVLADIISKYCHKGDRVAIFGKLQQNTWEKNGEKRSEVLIVVQEIQFLSSAKKKPETQLDFQQTPTGLSNAFYGTFDEQEKIQF